MRCMMSHKKIKKSLPVFPIGTMMKLTDLSARQIRYYEANGLITPKRTDTNRRLYSLDDVDTLLDIKDLLEEGLSIQAIAQRLRAIKESEQTLVMPMNAPTLTDDDVRRILYEELMMQQDWRHHTFHKN